MLAQTVVNPLALDASTLFVVATCVTALLGVFLLLAWTQDRIGALAWWGCAYLLGGVSVTLWIVNDEPSALMPIGISNALMFVACGMIWSAARLFHGRKVMWLAMFTGAFAWLVACTDPSFVESTTNRIILSSVIISIYTFLTAVELWRERRKVLLQRWPAFFVPMLHGAVFLFPIPLAGLLPEERGVVSLASGWVAIFALETLIYGVGTAFIVLSLAKERVVRIHKTAAATDPLTGLLNRRALFEGAELILAQLKRRKRPISVLMCDLDHFKRVNDRFGHATGDAALRQFADTVIACLRASDLVARMGGEEFAALLPGTGGADAEMVAERLRAAFEDAGRDIAGHLVGATVSIGVASGSADADIEALLTSADAALYRAKAEGRNRVVSSEEIVAGTVPAAGASDAAVAASPKADDSSAPVPGDAAWIARPAA